MKRLFRWVSRFLLGLSFTVFACLSADGAHNKAIVRAIRNGSAEFSHDKGKTWKKASPGIVLAANYSIHTDAEATVDIFMGENGPVVRLMKNTTLSFDRLDVENSGIEKIIDTQLDLKAGRIYGNVKKLSAASKYEVKTTAGVAGVRGTEYSISSDGRAQVLSGTIVLVYNIAGVPIPPITLNAGQQVAPSEINHRPTVTAISPDDPSLPEFYTLVVGISAKFKDPFSVSETTYLITIDTVPPTIVTIPTGSDGTLQGPQIIADPRPAYTSPPPEYFYHKQFGHSEPLDFEPVAFDTTNLALTKFFTQEFVNIDIINEPLEPEEPASGP